MSRRGAARAVTVGAAAVLVAASALARSGVEPFRGWHYHLAWYPTLLVLAGGLAWRTGRWPGGEAGARPGHAAASLFFWSAPVWYFFELVNFRLANWYYASAVAEAPVRWAGTWVAYATVVPALYLAHRWASELGLAEGWTRPRFEVRGVHLAGLAGLGVLFLALSLWRPDAFYPLIWGALTLLLEPWNYRRDPAGSLLGDLSRGRYRRIVRLLAGGLFIGLLWEFYNDPAGARWIYTVPGLERAKLFEMPLPGFLGFPVLALDCFVAYRALVNLGVAVPAWDGGTRPAGGEGREPTGAARLARGRTLAAAGLALIFCAAVQAGIDRWTVDSWAPSLEGLPLEAGLRERVVTSGVASVEELARADSASLARRGRLGPGEAGAAVRAARLATLRGLGTANASALWSSGIRSVCELAAAEERAVSRAVSGARPGPHAGRPARVRVWLRAARERCPERGPAGSP